MFDVPVTQPSTIRDRNARLWAVVLWAFQRVNVALSWHGLGLCGPTRGPSHHWHPDGT